jgi:hypothetical protein
MAKEAPKPTPAENTSPVSRIVEGREFDPAVLNGDIDQRMAALLKDHQEMGARPKQEPQNTDRDDVSVHPGRAGTDGNKTVIAKDEPKATKKR